MKISGFVPPERGDNPFFTLEAQGYTYEGELLYYPRSGKPKEMVRDFAKDWPKDTEVVYNTYRLPTGDRVINIWKKEKGDEEE